MAMSAQKELTGERVIISGAGVILTAALIWVGSSVQSMSREVIEMRVEIRGIIESKMRDDARTDSIIADIERRVRALEAKQR